MTALTAFWRNETPEPAPMRRPRRCASPTAYPLRPIDRFRTFQIAGGIFLAAYLLGHMNSAFVFARLDLGIDSDSALATAASSD